MDKVSYNTYVICVVMLVFTLLFFSSIFGGICSLFDEETQKTGKKVCSTIGGLLWLAGIATCSVFIHRYRVQAGHGRPSL